MTQVTVELIQKLRKISGAGILDCKNALMDTNGDIDKAMQLLREKGITQVLKKSTRETKEGLISAYIHPGNRIGVLLEVNCETDFVARTDEFKNLVKELGLQIAAASPLWISVEDVPEDVVIREREIYRKQALQEGKPEKVIEKIVEGKMQKFYQQVCLLEQPYIRDNQGKEKVKDMINSNIAKMGENIVVKRFVRFQLGETQNEI
ncbi:MAG: translation elongation factor Ts [Elusimicrobiota bacterium]|nr:translation elongation factor Ts [Elusimicrobiota bacterium]